MTEKIAILIRDRGHFTINDLNRFYEQTYYNYEIVIFADNLQLAKKKFSDIQISIYDNQYFKADFINSHIICDYLMFFNENEYFAQNDSLEKMFSQMKQYSSELSISSAVRFSNGSFFFYFTEDTEKIHNLNQNNVWLYTRDNWEFRKLSGFLFKKQLLSELMPNHQISLKKMILKAENAIFDCNSYYVFKEEFEYSVGDFSWQSDPVPDFIKVQNCDKFYEIIEEKISIALCVDSNYSKHLPTLIYSIDENCYSNIDIYILYYDVNCEMLELINQLNNVLSKINIILKRVTNYQYNVLSKISRDNSQLPIEAYFRLLLPDMFPQFHRILYLDVDMLVTSDLNKLWRTTFDGNFLIAAHDIPMIQNKNSWGYKLLGEFSGKNYINSGMLLFNLELFRKNNIFHRFIQFVIDTSKFYLFDDQDAINLFFNQHIKFVSVNNNFVLTSIFYENSLDENINILHYCGFSNPKPWKMQHKLPLVQFYEVQRYRDFKKRVTELLHPNDKIAVIISLPANYDQAIHKLESIDAQSYRNFDLFIFCVDDNLRKAVEDRYRYTSSVIYIKDKFHFESISRIIGNKYNYLYFMFDNNYLDKMNAFEELVHIAIDYDASIVATSYVAFNKNTHNYLFYDINESLECFDDLEFDEVSKWFTAEFRTIQGMLIKTEKLIEQMDINISENKLLEKIYKNTDKKYFLSKRFWVREE